MNGVQMRRGQRRYPGLSVSVAAAMLLLAAVELPAPAATLAEESRIEMDGQSAAIPSESVAEIIFPAPKQYAIVHDSSRQVQRLYTKSDVFFHPQNPEQPIRVLDIDEGGILIQPSHRGGSRYVSTGPLLSDSPTLTLIRTVRLEGLEYRFTVVDPLTDPESVIVSLTHSRAVLDKQVLHLPAHSMDGLGGTQREFRTGLFHKVKVTQVNEQIYEIEEEGLRPIIEDVADMLSSMRLKSDPSYFGLTSNLSLSLKSPFGEGILHSGGFTVKEMSIAETFGLKVGDIIVSLNGRAVNSPLNAYMVFQELFIRNRDVKEIRVVLLRDGALMAQGYRIR